MKMEDFLVLVGRNNDAKYIPIRGDGHTAMTNLIAQAIEMEDDVGVWRCVLYRDHSTRSMLHGHCYSYDNELARNWLASLEELPMIDGEINLDGLPQFVQDHVPNLRSVCEEIVVQRIDQAKHDRGLEVPR